MARADNSPIALTLINTPVDAKVDFDQVDRFRVLI
jgi:hypothetical protein